MPSRPPDFESLLARLTEEVEARGLEFMLIGGQAVLLHGRPRLTDDIDLALAAGPEARSRVLGASEALRLKPLPEDVEAFAALPGHGDLPERLLELRPEERGQAD